MTFAMPNEIARGIEITFDREEDGRWIAEVPALPGVLAYGEDKLTATNAAVALALHVVADRLEHGESGPL